MHLFIYSILLTFFVFVFVGVTQVVWCGNSKPVQTNLKMMKATRIGTTTATATATATATTTANGNGASNIEML